VSPTAGLAWGRRFLLCPPLHFDVTYRINPWMGSGHPVDPDKALAQWQTLADALRAVGAEVEELTPVPDLPDLVFTANAGIVDDGRVLVSRFRHAARQGESAVVAGWFAEAGFDVERSAAPLVHEGAGDALPFRAASGRTVLVGGHGPRTQRTAHEHVARRLGVEVLPVGLVDERLYHLDMTFCPLDDRHALIVPEAWDGEGRRLIGELVPDPLVLGREEAYRFMANAVVVGDVVLMPGCTAEVERRLSAWGYGVVVLDLSEFHKAGGSLRCLTLALDVDLDGRPVAATA
jgi:N-dimethylarginine dimethylaminohydrolase